MADNVIVREILDDELYYICLMTNESDGTGESAVTKIDVSGITEAATRLTLEYICYATTGMKVILYEDATTDELILELPEDSTGMLDFTNRGRYPGIPNAAASGVTGDIKLTTLNHTSGDKYSIYTVWKKHGVTS